jgi:hypothetical protein
MKRLLRRIVVLFVSTSIVGCVSAKQKAEEQQEIERSISSSSNPDAIKGCSFVMNLRPDGLHKGPEAQVASLVIPKKGVSWVVFGDSGKYDLYSCSQRSTRSDPEMKVATPTTTVETMSTETTSAPLEPTPTRAPSAASPDVTAREQPEAKVETSQRATKSVYDTRVTSNPEAVRGCKFLESFAEYRTVLHFQEDVVRAGGNLGYVVATNKDGDIIGESYLCSDQAKP